MKKFHLVLCIVALVACADALGNKRVHQNEVILKNDICLYQGKPFTGQVWTDDDKSACLEVEDGNMVRMTYYYKNGNKLYEASEENETFYAPNGNEISETDILDYDEAWEQFYKIRGMLQLLQ